MDYCSSVHFKPGMRGSPYPDERDELLTGVFIGAAESFRQSSEQKAEKSSNIKEIKRTSYCIHG